MGDGFDAIVIGAGACGCTTAYELARKGARAALLDSGEVGREASWASAGIVGPGASPERDPWFAEATRLSAERYAELDGELRELTGRSIGYGGAGSLLVARTEEELPAVRENTDLYRSAGVEAQLLDGAEARRREPVLPEDVVEAALNPEGRHLDARAYTAAAAAAAQVLGVEVFAGRPVTGLQWSGDRVTGVRTDAGSLHADVVVNAAGAWAGRMDERLTHPVFPVHGQIMAVAAPPAGLRHNVSRAAGYGYATPRPDGRIVVGATHEAWGFAKRVTPDGLASLSDIVTSVLPVLASQPILDIWSGLRPGTVDSLPTVGPDPRAASGFLWATGHYSSGMMQMPATALVVTDLALGRAPRLAIDQVTVERYLDGRTIAATPQIHAIERRRLRI
ncbi:MAG: FAD-dependent oxidoreductase [Spirochaetaceae bacterium]|nr:FAD-dependent oxidoreductase [Spirochaetaceae bacterium]